MLCQPTTHLHIQEIQGSLKVCFKKNCDIFGAVQKTQPDNQALKATILIFLTPHFLRKHPPFPVTLQTFPFSLLYINCRAVNALDMIYVLPL